MIRAALILSFGWWSIAQAADKVLTVTEYLESRPSFGYENVTIRGVASCMSESLCTIIDPARKDVMDELEFSGNALDRDTIRKLSACHMNYSGCLAKVTGHKSDDMMSFVLTSLVFEE